MQRNSVVFAEPEGPMTTTTSPAATESETLRSTSSVPKRFEMPETSSIGRYCTRGASMAVEDTSFKMPPIKRKRVAHAEIETGSAEEYLKGRQPTLDDLPARHGELPQPDDGDERRRLDQIDTEVDERRRGEAERLGKDDDLQHQPPSHAEAAGGVPLRLRQRQDAGAEHLAHEGGVVERQHHHDAPERRPIDAGERQQVGGEGQQHEERDAAHHEEVGDHRGAQGARAQDLQA